MNTNTTSQTAEPAPLRAAAADELATAIRDGANSQGLAGYLEGKYVRTAGTAADERQAWHEARDVRDELLPAMWRRLYDYAGGVGDLRRELSELLDSWGESDVEDLDALTMYEDLQQLVTRTFGAEL